MRALWDYPVLPYKCVVPWPEFYTNGYKDWIQSADYIESWLVNNIGPHWSTWTWSMWTLHNSELCGVSFARERSCSLFLLRFS